MNQARSSTPHQRFRLREARLRASLSQKDVAERLGVTQPTVSNWESGKSGPDNEQMVMLQGFLELSLSAGEEEGGGPFGAWLNKTRIEKEWTVKQLADACGLSSVQIYNIESGRTENPRKATRDRIERALGEKTPAEVVAATEELARVGEVGSLVDFDPHGEADWPDEEGVYVFYDISQRPIYIGQSENIRQRIKEHKEKFWFRPPIVSSASYIAIREKKLRRQVEQILVRVLKSNAVINKHYVDRG